MEDLKNQYPLNGNWGHPLHHTRPFLYVPQPTQPYFTSYPWNMNPYSQYGFPWPAMSYGRYMAPVQYMQQPYVVPQAPLYPTDYRRSFSHHYSFPSTQDGNYPNHAEQSSLQRDTACSEAQTEPYDVVSDTDPPVEDLGSNRAVVSSTPAAVLYPGKEEVPSGSDRPVLDAPLPQRVRFNSQKQGDPAIQQSSLGESSAAFYAESSQGCLEECVLSDVMPLDGSSIHDVCLTGKGTESDQPLLSQNLAVQDGQQMEDGASTPYPDSGVHDCGPSNQSLESKEANSPSESIHSKGDSNLVSGSDPIPEADSPVSPGSGDVEDLPFRILRLPCTKMTTTSLLEKSNPLWCAEKVSSLLPPVRSLLSTGSYSYYPHADQERQSVLSPSLDELSSRDELFSTDVEDVDLVSEPVCVQGDRLDDEGNDSYSALRKGDLGSAGSEEHCTACHETCSTCGLSLRASSPEFAHADYPEMTDCCGRSGVLDEADSVEGEDEWSSYEAHEVPVNYRPQSSRRSASPCYRAPTHRPKQDYCGESGGTDRGEQGHGYLRECCERKAVGRTDKNTGRPSRSAPPRSYSDKQWGDCTTGPDKEGWGNGAGKPKAKPWKPGNRNQELGLKAARRGSSCKRFELPKPRRNEFDDYNDAECSHYKRGRGSAKKKGTRY
ncbi:bucky ball [Alosa sapidissima]|uniref:bucky ball n=1 Tax=Alosa sapidissima TaxID=34773 RepID=UPI001C081360|nr:bucky ball [Alosa sapidissima]